MSTIDELRGLVERAKPGTWYVFTNRHPETNGSPWGCIEAVRHPMGGAGSPPSGMSAMTWSGDTGRANAALIVAAVNALPALLAVVEAAREVEWVPMYAESSIKLVDRCPCCDAAKQDGHTKDCSLHSALARLDGEVGHG